MNREEIKDDKKNRFLNASFKLFVNKGLRNTSIQDIADEAGLGKGTFYYYFKDKYEVRDILISFKSRDLYSKAFKKLKLKKNLITLSDKVIYFINEIIEDFVKQPDLLKFISKDLSYGIYKNALDQMYKQNEQDIFELFVNGKKENGERLKNPKIILSNIIELVGSTCYNSILYNRPLPINDFKPFLYDNIKAIIEYQSS